MARLFPIAAIALAGATLLVARSPGLASEAAVRVPAPAVVAPAQGSKEVAVFAGGCFWGVQGVFSHVKGVISTTAGYAGGKPATAQYDRVSTGTTGHAESVRVVFNPGPGQLRRSAAGLFFGGRRSDPAQSPGPDEGTQYRTALFPQSPAQDKVARAYIAQLAAAHVYPQPIVTQIERNTGFFPAEEHHQNYMARNPTTRTLPITTGPRSWRSSGCSRRAGADSAPAAQARLRGSSSWRSAMMLRWTSLVPA